MNPALLTSMLGFLSSDLPGIGGAIKLRPEDFLVEEIPLYEPAGEGEYLYMFIEKRTRTTSDVVRHIARTFWARKSDIGYAGLKDKHAITRQYFSLHLPEAKGEREPLDRLDNDTVKLLWATRHRNKLRRGHLVGNRFAIRIRQIQPTTVVAAKRVLDRLQHRGFPNFIGQQRFGYRQNNHIIGRHLLRGRWQKTLDEMLGKPSDPQFEATYLGRQAYTRGDYAEALEQWPRHLRPDRQALDALRQGKSAKESIRMIDIAQRRFLISALQSVMFNRVLDQRLASKTFDRLIEGDLAWKHENRSVFAVDQATADRENAPGGRIERHEISPSGPMWGPGMAQAGGLAGRLEEEALGEFGLHRSNLQGEHLEEPPKGARRPLRVFLGNQEISGGTDEHGPYVRVAFDLPRGAYATIVLREIMKTDDLERSARDSGDERSGASGFACGSSIDHNVDRENQRTSGDDSGSEGVSKT